MCPAVEGSHFPFLAHAGQLQTQLSEAILALLVAECSRQELSHMLLGKDLHLCLPLSHFSWECLAQNKTHGNPAEDFCLCACLPHCYPPPSPRPNKCFRRPPGSVHLLMYWAHVERSQLSPPTMQIQGLTSDHQHPFPLSHLCSLYQHLLTSYTMGRYMAHRPDTGVG